MNDQEIVAAGERASKVHQVAAIVEDGLTPFIKSGLTTIHGTDYLVKENARRQQIRDRGSKVRDLELNANTSARWDYSEILNTILSLWSRFERIFSQRVKHAQQVRADINQIIALRDRGMGHTGKLGIFTDEDLRDLCKMAERVLQAAGAADQAELIRRISPRYLQLTSSDPVILPTRLPEDTGSKGELLEPPDIPPLYDIQFYQRWGKTSDPEGDLARAEARLLRYPYLLEAELYDLIYSALTPAMERTDGRIPTLQDVLAVPVAEFAMVSVENGERQIKWVAVNPAAEIKRILTLLYDNFYDELNYSSIRYRLFTSQMVGPYHESPDYSPQVAPEAKNPNHTGLLASVESTETVGDAITHLLMKELLERAHEVIPGNKAPLKFKVEWLNEYWYREYQETTFQATKEADRHREPFPDEFED